MMEKAKKSQWDPMAAKFGIRRKIHLVPALCETEKDYEEMVRYMRRSKRLTSASKRVA